MIHPTHNLKMILIPHLDRVQMNLALTFLQDKKRLIKINPIQIRLFRYSRCTLLSRDIRQKR